MTVYSPKLTDSYTKHRDTYTATDASLFALVDRIGVSGKDVLDFGCGDGRYAVPLCERGSQKVVGIDVSPAMVELAQKSTALAGLPTEHLVADGADLPFPDNSFDVVFANMVLHHFADTRIPIAEIQRVLKTDGYLACAFSAFSFSANMAAYANTEVPLRLGTGAHAVIVHDLLKPVGEVREAFFATGFSCITYDVVPNPYVAVDDSYPHKELVTLQSIVSLAQKI